uniref:Si:ch73-105b23.6 n=1 Tax=Acanthochromis polyacanthus TaxID=80966 RepID=A0A3Q1EUP3_9TELE
MVYGSLHFITFDGTEYSFKALGEFVILRLSSATGSNIFTLQGQTDKLHTDTGGIIESPVVVRMAAFHQGIGKVVHVGVKDFAVRCLSVNRCAAVYAGGLHVVVWRSEGYNQLTVMVEVPQTYYNRTVGLMGLWSSNHSDDFLMSDGKVLLSEDLNPPSEERLHQFGWSAVPGPESLLFSSPPREPLEHVSTGKLLETVSPTEVEELRRTCERSEECVFDILASGLADLGQKTLDAQKQFEKLSQIYDGYLTWTPLSTQPVQLNIQVSDKLTSSLFTPILRVCNCLNGGTCQYDSIAESHQQGKFQVVGCLCPKGFSGTFCGNTTDICRGKPCFRGVQCQSESEPGQFTCGMCPGTTISIGKEGYKCFKHMCASPFPFPCHKDYAECSSTKYNYTCTCKPGFAGDGQNCTIDECAALMACENAKYECKNTPGSFECVCRYQNTKNTEQCYNLFNVSVTWSENSADGLKQLDDILRKGFKNKYYNITKTGPGQGSRPDEYRIAVSSDTPHWYIMDYMTRASRYYGLDECKAKEVACVHPAQCKNTYGGYRCVCNGTADVEKTQSCLIVLGLVLGIGIPLFLLLLLLVLACFCCYCKRTVTGLPHMMPDYINVQHNPPPFNYSDPALHYMTHSSPRIIDNITPRHHYR